MAEASSRWEYYGYILHHDHITPLRGNMGQRHARWKCLAVCYRPPLATANSMLCPTSSQVLLHATAWSDLRLALLAPKSRDATAWLPASEHCQHSLPCQQAFVLATAWSDIASGSDPVRHLRCSWLLRGISRQGITAQHVSPEFLFPSQSHSDFALERTIPAMRFQRSFCPLLIQVWSLLFSASFADSGASLLPFSLFLLGGSALPPYSRLGAARTLSLLLPVFSASSLLVCVRYKRESERLAISCRWLASGYCIPFGLLGLVRLSSLDPRKALKPLFPPIHSAHGKIVRHRPVMGMTLRPPGP